MWISILGLIVYLIILVVLVWADKKLEERRLKRFEQGKASNPYEKDYPR